MSAHWNLKDGCFINAFKPSAKSLFQDPQPWIVLNTRIEIIEARMSLPHHRQGVRWAVWCWWVWYSLYSIYVSCDHYSSVGKKCNGLVSVSFSIQFSFHVFQRNYIKSLQILGVAAEMMSVPIFMSYLDEIPIGLPRILTTAGSLGASYPAKQVRVPAELQIILESYWIYLG